MKERPILFSGEMVRAILDGRKTQTRRMVKYIPALGDPEEWCHRSGAPDFDRLIGDYRRFCPYGAPGDRLWVRETWALAHLSVDCEGVCDDVEEFTGRLIAANRDGYWAPIYAADADDINNHPIDRLVKRYRPSIHMPRWASRLMLEVVSVRVERLQDITEAEALAEGIQDGGCNNCGESSHPNPCGCADPEPLYVDAFAWLWNSINGKRMPWVLNPWVWVVTFKPL